MADYGDNVINMLEAKKRSTKEGVDFWKARDLQEILGYSKWDKFTAVVERGIAACDSSGVPTADQFARTGNMVSIGSGAQREVDDYFLTRYACYLIAMNGDPSKPEVGFAQTYFAVQTRRQELRDKISGRDARLQLRERVMDHNRELSSAASRAGVEHFPFFQDSGIRGLYGGLGLKDIKKRKQISEKEDLLDCSGTDELTFNDFRLVLTKQQLVNADVKGQQAAEQTHNSVGKTVRNAIREARGTMPEDLKPEPSIRKEIAKVRRKKLATAKLQIPEQT